MSADLTGAIQGQRQGSARTVHTFPVTFSTSGIGSGKLLAVLRASATNPVEVEVSAQVVTAFDGGTPVLTVGTTTAATQWLASGDITEGTPGYYPASNASTKFRLVADTSIYAKYTSDASDTAGAAVIIVKEERQSVAPLARTGVGVYPNLVSANVTDGTWTLVFSVAVTGTSGFSGVVQGVATTLTYRQGHGTDTLIFDASVAAVALDVVTLDYTPGNVVNIDYPLSAITSFSVTNDTN